MAARKQRRKKTAKKRARAKQPAPAPEPTTQARITALLTFANEPVTHDALFMDFAFVRRGEDGRPYARWRGAGKHAGIFEVRGSEPLPDAYPMPHTLVELLSLHDYDGKLELEELLTFSGKGLTPAELEQANTDALRKHQDVVRWRLNQIIENSRGAEKAMAPWFDAALKEQLISEPGFAAGSGVTHRSGIDSVEGAYTLALALLFDADKARDLRRCAREACSRYFVIWNPQQRGREYCSDDCSSAGNRAKTKARVQAHRKRRKKAKTKRRT